MLYILTNIFFITGCVRSISHSGSESNVLEIVTPSDATDLKFEINYSPENSDCNIDTESSSNNSSSKTIKIKNTCLKNGEYTIKLSLKLDGKDYYGEGTINKDTEIKDNKISLSIKLSVTDGSKIKSESEEVDISNIEVPSGFKYFGKKQQTITVFKDFNPKEEIVTMYIFENTEPDLNCNKLELLSCAPRTLVKCNTPECDKINDPKSYGCIGSTLPTDDSNKFDTDYLCKKD